MSAAVLTRASASTILRDSNSAGSALPGIPRRTSSHTRVLHRHTASGSSDGGANEEAEAQDATLSSSSDASDSQITIGGGSRSSKKSVVHAAAAAAVEPASTSTANAPPSPTGPDSSDADLTPRPISDRRHNQSSGNKPSALKLDLHSLHARSLPVQPQTTLGIPTSIQSQLVRKKSGEPLKSSLKARRDSTPHAGPVSVLFGPLSASDAVLASKSEPATPTKAVKFDEQLERVKLFIAEHKPSEVSRDGSPTDDTDSDFPSFIYGNGERGPSDDERMKKELSLHMMDVLPDARPGLGGGKSADDVVLEELKLSPESNGTSLTGRVRVRNLAFEKWVAVRFTFDAWQTTSEVTGKYQDSVDGGAYDRFVFTVRLADMLTRIEDKMLVLAVRYTVAGREIWDNNRGGNYRVKFGWAAPKRAPPPPLPAAQVPVSIQASAPAHVRPPKHRSRSNRFHLSDEEVSDLTTKLEKVASGESPQAADSPVFVPSQTSTEDAFSFKSSARLSSRYDFAASSKVPWRPVSPSPLTSPNNSVRTRIGSFPGDGPAVPWPTKGDKHHRRSLTEVFGGAVNVPRSPRDLEEEEEYRRSMPANDDDDDDDKPFKRAAFSPGSSFSRGRTPLSHTRGYFDLGVSHTPRAVRATPPGTPSSGLSSRCNSYPPMLTPPTGPAMVVPQAWKAALRVVDGAGSEESTPSITNDSLSRSTTPSPMEDPVSPSEDPNNYRAFINQFCFYTGMNSPANAPGTPVRSPSTSSVMSRSSSFEDVVRATGAVGA